MMEGGGRVFIIYNKWGYRIKLAVDLIDEHFEFEENHGED